MGRTQIAAVLSSLLHPPSMGFRLEFEIPGLPDACIIGEFITKLKSTNCIMVTRETSTFR